MENCNDIQCHKEKVELRKQLNEVKEKIEKVEEAIASCRSVIAEKSIEIESLMKERPIQFEIFKPDKVFEQFLNVFL